jgi:hypothetical protein
MVIGHTEGLRWMYWLLESISAHTTAGSGADRFEPQVQWGQHGSEKVRGGADTDGLECTEVSYARGGVRTTATLLCAGVDSEHHHHAMDRRGDTPSRRVTNEKRC